MSVSVTFNGTSYTIPTFREQGWATQVTSWIQAVSSGSLQTTGGAFTLTADLNFGASFGLLAAYFSGRTNASTAGLLRLGNTETIGWRNAANSANLLLGVDGSNRLYFGSMLLSDGAALTASRALVSSAAGLPTVSAVTATELGYVSGVTSAIQTQLDLKATDADLDAHTAATSGVHGAAGSVVGTSDTQTLTNKTFSDAVTLAEVATPATPASGFGKVYFKSDGFLYQLNDDGTETKVGGSPAITLTRVTATPMRGVGMFRITKDAANRQGEGVSYDFTIARADQAKPITVSFEYQPSANFTAGSDSATGDLVVYAYDVTNATVIQLTPYKVTGGSGGYWKYSGVFQTASNSTSYRLIFHIAGTGATAWTFDFDNVVVGPQVQLYGAPVTDWTSYTPTVSNLGTGSSATNAGWWRRIGDSMQIQLHFIKDGSGGSGASVVTFSLPSGYSVDTAKLSGQNVVGFADTFGVEAATQFDTSAVDISSNVLRIHNNGSAGQFTGADFRASSQADIWVTVPIVGWGSNCLMSSDADTRVVAAHYTDTAGTARATGATYTLAYATKDFDTHTTISSGQWTAPVAGKYSVSANLYLTGVINSGGEIQLFVRKNGTNAYLVDAKTYDNANTRAFVLSGSVTLDLTAGDYIEVRFFNNSGASLTQSSSAGYNNLSIERISGPSVIAASELVAAAYRTNTGQTCTSGSFKLIDFEDRDFDTHSAVTTGASWKFTAPAAGKYRVSGNVLIQAAAGWEAGESLQLALFKNGSAVTNIGQAIQTASHSQALAVGGSCLVALNAGDYIDLRVFQDSDSDKTTDTGNTYCWVCIDRIGL
jgi:hypothetical protein